MEEFNGFYRGKVVDNYDPLVKGRLKVYVRGVYPEQLSKTGDNLPWSEPVMPLFGGDYTNKTIPGLNKETGVTTIPHVGAELWMFFENGNHMLPRHFGACQGGAGWHSEHKNQHVIKTDNVRIRVDEEPTLPLSGSAEKLEHSTCKFDTYNKHCTQLSQKHAKNLVPTRVDIEILNKGAGALNLRITGSVNISLSGDMFMEQFGNRHETLYGNLYRKHVGDIHEEHIGLLVSQHIGDERINLKGDEYVVHDGDEDLRCTGSLDENYEKTVNIQIGGDKVETVYGSVFYDVMGSYQSDVSGPTNMKSGGDLTLACNNQYNYATNDIVQSSQKGCIYRQCWMLGAPENPPMSPYLPASIIDKANAIRSESVISRIDVANVLLERYITTPAGYIKDISMGKIERQALTPSLSKITDVSYGTMERQSLMPGAGKITDYSTGQIERNALLSMNDVSLIMTRNAGTVINDNSAGFINHTQSYTPSIPPTPPAPPTVEMPVIPQTKAYAMADRPVMSAVTSTIKSLVTLIQNTFKF